MLAYITQSVCCQEQLDNIELSYLNIATLDLFVPQINGKIRLMGVRISQETVHNVGYNLLFGTAAIGDHLMPSILLTTCLFYLFFPVAGKQLDGIW